MSVARLWDGSAWVPAFVGARGPSGVVSSNTPPEDTTVLWADTSEAGDAVIPVGGSAGEMLVKASGTDYDAGWSNPSTVPFVRVAGRWRGGGGVNFGSQLLTEGVARSSPLMVSMTTDFDRIAVIVQTAGSSGAEIRLGAYAFDNDGLNLSLVFDAGTVTADTTGVKTITIAKTLVPGAYLLIAASQGTPATHPTIRTTQNSVVEPYANTISTPNNFITGHRCFGLSFSSGAFPATVAYPASAGSSVNPYNVSLRIAV